MEERSQDLQYGRQYACPECSQVVAGPEGQLPRLIQCPHCRAQFFVSDDDPTDEEEEDQQDAQGEDDQELSALRIRQISTLRRTLHRTRSYFVVGVATCLIAAIQLVLIAIEHVIATGWHSPAVCCLTFAILAICAASYFSRRAGAISRELRRSLLSEPTTPPDFSTLSDGSQHWKNLEGMSPD